MKWSKKTRNSSSLLQLSFPCNCCLRGLIFHALPSKVKRGKAHLGFVEVWRLYQIEVSQVLQDDATGCVLAQEQAKPARNNATLVHVPAARVSPTLHSARWSCIRSGYTKMQRGMTTWWYFPSWCSVRVCVWMCV